MMIAAKRPRLAFLDVVRGIALVAMATYHFGWDLSFFGYVEPHLVNDGPWKIYARCIASSFLFLVGVGLILAHDKGIRWQGFWKRWLKVAAAALVITVATYYFTPDAFIFFGILHQIAFASLAGLVFLRLPWFALAALGLGWIFAAPYLQFDALNGLHLAWTGLASESVRSNDFVPVFPWFGAVLLGMGAAKFALARDLFARASRETFSATKPGRVLGFLGRHSLITYLVHQPILIALIYLYSLVFPATIDEAALRATFAESCQTSCETDNSASQCAFYCPCLEQGLTEIDQFTPLMTGKIAFSDEEPQKIATQCSIDMFALPDE